VGHIDEIADRYVDEYARLDPISATTLGIAGFDDKLTDLAPEGFGARAELAERTLAQLGVVEPRDDTERIAKEAMRERLESAVERYDAGLVTSEVNVVSGPLNNLRGVFDLMPLAGEEAAANIATRMHGVPTALAQLRQTLNEAAEHGHVAARRQMLEVAHHCEAWVDPAQDDFWPGLARRVIDAGPVPETLAAQLNENAEACRAATAEFGTYLRDELAQRGRENEAVGRELYGIASRYFLGATIDLDETYAWGIAELARIDAEMRAVADKIQPGADAAAAIEALNRDPSRRIEGREAFRDWMQELADRTVSNLNGTHFDIPEQVQVIECCLAPVSDGGIYYTGPSEDFSRPGRMWWAVPQGEDSFATWQEVTTVYHEGVPGHHLQVAQTAVRADILNRWQRRLAWCSGHGEGWALYAERLMDELGYLDDPGEKMGMLDSQAFRATRVVIDIGMHLELEIPADNPFGFHPGERWNRELGREFLRAHSSFSDAMLQYELNRYLGWPGQAPSYKVGERVWLQARADAQARKGADFDLKAFHRAALDLGSLGLDPLRESLGRL
jgi:uncharacterized protein (DUF885 family)